MIGARVARVQRGFDRLDALGLDWRVEDGAMVVERGGVELVRVPADRPVDVVLGLVDAAIEELQHRRANAAEGEA